MKQSAYIQHVSKSKKPHVSAERNSHHQGSRFRNTMKTEIIQL